MRPIPDSRAARALRPTLLALACTFALGACSSSDDDGDALPTDDTPAAEMPDTGSTPGTDTGVDAPVDGGTDTGSNTGTDTNTGAGTETETEAETETGTETGTETETETEAETDMSMSDGERFAFVSGATPDFGTGQIERLTLGDTIVSSGRTPATTSDIRVATDGTDVYEIGRFNLDSLTRFAPDELETPVWQYSVNGDDTASNPYEIVFASETKAYVVRYGSPLVWIVDPTASDESTFKTGEIDLSAYDEDGVPNASDAVLVDGRLFVLMQRLGGSNGFAPLSDGYVAVIDTATDTEIDTDPDTDGLPGIPLDSSNPEGLLYPDGSDVVYVVGRGNIFGNAEVSADPYDGGIETIDTESFERTLLLDDGTAEDNEGFFADALVVSPGKGYVLTYASFGVTTLRAFNPMTGALDDGAVAGLEGVDISALALDPEGRVWVGLNQPETSSVSPGFTVLDPSDDGVLIDLVPTEFNPNDIVFVDGPAAS